MSNRGTHNLNNRICILKVSLEFFSHFSIGLLFISQVWIDSLYAFVSYVYLHPICYFKFEGELRASFIAQLHASGVDLLSTEQISHSEDI